MSYFLRSRLVKLVCRMTAKHWKCNKPEVQAKVKNSFDPIGPSPTSPSLNNQTGGRNDLDTNAPSLALQACEQLKMPFARALRPVSPVPTDSEGESGVSDAAL